MTLDNSLVVRKCYGDPALFVMPTGFKHLDVFVSALHPQKRLKS